ncbi:ATP-binding cassette domain-containing protein [Butyrivibrio sp. AE3004]|uniref:ATP-binding cassette domain-containing protein n=1 Tax=Butyrivibrio sp. AE3004 TaxID=1506994 RepID=UPI0004948DB3|nr:ABC transporter ATP-binding protein [Butyrivibrio sp. AE3004]
MNQIYLDAVQIATYILTSIGLWNIFKKCGGKPIWSLVPIVREYQLSLCAYREEDGRRYAIVAALYYPVEILMYAVDKETKFYLLVIIVALSLSIAKVIYNIRATLGLINVFGKKKIWILAFVFFGSITMLYWGFSKKFMPTKKIQRWSDYDDEDGPGKDVSAIDDGLTINITDKTVFSYFRKKTLLRDIHMTIPKGHMVLLLGGSGAGKTTFLNAITGYEKANAKVTLGDMDVYNDYGKMMYDIGFVPQQDLVRGNDTVTLTLADAAALRLPSNMPIMEKIERITKVLDQFGLSAVKNNLVDKLSGGQKKRVSIAMEFISDPTLFILDEPDSGLDGVVARGLFTKLRTIADEGKIVIVITHTPDRVADLFDDVIVLVKDKNNTGRLAFFGAIEEAYEFFGRKSMEEILLEINPRDVGGEGNGEEFIAKFADLMKGKWGEEK